MSSSNNQNAYTPNFYPNMSSPTPTPTPTPSVMSQAWQQWHQGWLQQRQQMAAQYQQPQRPQQSTPQYRHPPAPQPFNAQPKPGSQKQRFGHRFQPNTDPYERWEEKVRSQQEEIAAMKAARRAKEAGAAGANTAQQPQQSAAQHQQPAARSTGRPAVGQHPGLNRATQRLRTLEEIHRHEPVVIEDDTPPIVIEDDTPPVAPASQASQTPPPPPPPPKAPKASSHLVPRVLHLRRRINNEEIVESVKERRRKWIDSFEAYCPKEHQHQWCRDYWPDDDAAWSHFIEASDYELVLFEETRLIYKAAEAQKRKLIEEGTELRAARRLMENQIEGSMKLALENRRIEVEAQQPVPAAAAGKKPKARGARKAKKATPPVAEVSPSVGSPDEDDVALEAAVLSALDGSSEQTSESAEGSLDVDSESEPDDVDDGRYVIEIVYPEGKIPEVKREAFDEEQLQPATTEPQRTVSLEAKVRETTASQPQEDDVEPEDNAIGDFDSAKEAVLPIAHGAIHAPAYSYFGPSQEVEQAEVSASVEEDSGEDVEMESLFGGNEEIEEDSGENADMDSLFGEDEDTDEGSSQDDDMASLFGGDEETEEVSGQDDDMASLFGGDEQTEEVSGRDDDMNSLFGDDVEMGEEDEVTDGQDANQAFAFFLGKRGENQGEIEYELDILPGDGKETEMDLCIDSAVEVSDGSL